MINIFFLFLALIFTLWKLTKEKNAGAAEIFLSYVLLFNMGIMGLLTGYGFTFKNLQTATLIGWVPHSQFQFESAMAYLSYGILGILTFWKRGSFREAAITGWSIFLFGSFLVHLYDYLVNDNTSLWNIGLFGLFNTLFPPLIALSTYFYNKGVIKKF